MTAKRNRRGSNQYETRGPAPTGPTSGQRADVAGSLRGLAGAEGDAHPRADAVLVAARAVVLDTVEALAGQIDSVTLVGAQAVYERTSHLVLAVAATTVDGDFTIDPDLLLDAPAVGTAMSQSGFAAAAGTRPGIWTKPVHGTPVTVDLIVPDAFAGGGRRGARLPHPHGKGAAGRAVGLELAVVDRDVMTIGSFDPDDQRTVDVNVAGPTALLCAKAHKLRKRIRDRSRQDRIRPKDAGDMWRIMATTDPAAIADRFRELSDHQRVGPVAVNGAEYLTALFQPGGPGVGLAVDAFAGAEPDRQIRDVITEWMGRFTA